MRRKRARETPQELMGRGGEERDTGWSQSGSILGPKLAPTLVRARWHACRLARPRSPARAPTDAGKVFGEVREAFPDRSCHRQGRHDDGRKKRKERWRGGWRRRSTLASRCRETHLAARGSRGGGGKRAAWRSSWTVGAISTPTWFGPGGMPAGSSGPARRPWVLSVPGRHPVESERPSLVGSATAREGIVTKNRGEERRKKRRGRRRNEKKGRRGGGVGWPAATVGTRPIASVRHTRLLKAAGEEEGRGPSGGPLGQWEPFQLCLVQARWRARQLTGPAAWSPGPTDAGEVFGGVRAAFLGRPCHL